MATPGEFSTGGGYPFDDSPGRTVKFTLQWGPSELFDPNSNGPGAKYTYHIEFEDPEDRAYVCAMYGPPRDEDGLNNFASSLGKAYYFESRDPANSTANPAVLVPAIPFLFQSDATARAAEDIQTGGIARGCVWAQQFEPGAKLNIELADGTDSSKYRAQVVDDDNRVLGEQIGSADGGHNDTYYDAANLKPSLKDAFAYDPQNRLEEVETTNDDGSSKDTKFDPNNTHPYKELDVAKAPDGTVTGVQVVLDNAGASIGQLFGSSLGSALGGSGQLGRLVGSVAGGAIGSVIGQTFVQVVKTSITSDLSKVSLTDVFSGQNLANAGIGAISSFLTAELGSALKIPGFGGQLFNAAANGFTFSLLSQVSAKIQAGLTFDAAIATMDWSGAVTGALGSAGIQIENLFGSYLGQLLVPAKSHAGAIGGQLLGAIGSFLLPGIGSLIGDILGTVIFDAFSNTPHPAATDLIDQRGYLYDYHHYQSFQGGSYDVPDKMGAPAISIVNAYLTAVNGAALDHSKQVVLGYQTDRNPKCTARRPVRGGGWRRVQGSAASMACIHKGIA